MLVFVTVSFKAEHAAAVETGQPAVTHTPTALAHS